jgi:ribosomal protein L40E
MSSETSTKRPLPAADAGLRPWHMFLLLSMVGATAAVVFSGQSHPHPVALVVLSGTVVAAGLVGVAVHLALSGFWGGGRAPDARPLGSRAVEALEREKALVLRSIKELEFDRAMGKVAEADFEKLGGRLRARALTLMQDLDRSAAGSEPAAAPTARAAAPARVVEVGVCGGCGTANDADARFCKQCGAKL